MCDTCANCKWLKFLGNDRLFPYRCRKEKAGVTHSVEWVAYNGLNAYKCDKWEAKR